MALKDTWQDKIDGVDIIYAKDINEIANSVIGLEEKEGNETNIELAETLEGNETDKAPSVKAVNGGLAGKVDKPTEGWAVPVSKGADKNGNITYGEIPYSYSPRKEAIPVYSSAKTLKTEKAIDENDTVNLAQLIEELAKKLDADTTSGSGYTVVYSRDAMGNQQLIPIIASNDVDALARFTKKSHGKWGKEDAGGVLVTGYPPAGKPFLCAPVKYVDDQVAPIIKELGSIVKTITDSSSEVVIETPAFLPDGVKPNIYIEYATASLPWMASDGRSDTTEVDFSQIMVGDESGPKRTIDIERGSYITLEEGENMLFFGFSYPYPDPPDDSGDWTAEAATPLLSYKIIYQVKVGG